MVFFFRKTYPGGVKWLYLGFYFCHYLLNQRPDVWIFTRLIDRFNGMNNRAMISIIETFSNLV